MAEHDEDEGPTGAEPVTDTDGRVVEQADMPTSGVWPTAPLDEPSDEPTTGPQNADGEPVANVALAASGDAGLGVTADDPSHVVEVVDEPHDVEVDGEVVDGDEIIDQEPPSEPQPPVQPSPPTPGGPVPPAPPTPPSGY